MEMVAFGDNHSLADIARWIMQNRGEAEDLHMILGQMLDGTFAQMVALKDIVAAFIAKCDEIGGSRELSLAKTNAEQALMWAVKHLTA
jgi:hypothetical protein